MDSTRPVRLVRVSTAVLGWAERSSTGWMVNCIPCCCAMAKLSGRRGVIRAQAQKPRHEGAVRAVALAGGGKAAVETDISLDRQVAQKLLGRVADPGGTRCMAGRGADHHRPENVKQTHPMHILSRDAGRNPPGRAVPAAKRRPLRTFSRFYYTAFAPLVL